VTPSRDYVALNVPGLLSRTVKVQDPVDSSKWLPDPTWHEHTKELMAALLFFYRKNKLLKESQNLPPTEQVVLKFSDFTELGQAFLQSGAEDRWLRSFDRPGNRKARSDVRYLEKQLQLIRESR
jgi:hypothetical protein